MKNNINIVINIFTQWCLEMFVKSIIVYFAWNNSIPYISELNNITFQQSICINVIFSILFNNVHRTNTNINISKILQLLLWKINKDTQDDRFDNIIKRTIDETSETSETKSEKSEKIKKKFK
jgi:hypothetical protein